MFGILMKWVRGKKAVDSTGALGEQGNDSGASCVESKSRVKRFIASCTAGLASFYNFLPVLRFYLHLLLAIFSFSAVLVYGYWYVRDMTEESVDNGHSVMVNVITGEVFVGKVEHQSKIEVQKVTDPVSDIESAAAESRLKYRAPRLDGGDLGKAKVGIVITDLGLDREQTMEVLEMEKCITLSFSPYADDIAGWADRAYSSGFEVMMQWPMQPADYAFDDPGPYAMLLKLSTEDNIRRLEKLIDMSSKVIGFVTKPSEIFSFSSNQMQELLGKIERGNYVLVYSNPRNIGNMEQVCKASKVECLFTSFIAEDETDEEYLYKTLSKAATEAKRNGYAIVYLNSYPVTLKVFKRWRQELNPDDIIVTPVSTLLGFGK